MSEMIDYKAKKKREYYREWRKNHPEAVRAAQLRYWMKKAEEAKQTEATMEIRSTTGGIENAQ